MSVNPIQYKGPGPFIQNATLTSSVWPTIWTFRPLTGLSFSFGPAKGALLFEPWPSQDSDFGLYLRTPHLLALAIPQPLSSPGTRFFVWLGRCVDSCAVCMCVETESKRPPGWFRGGGRTIDLAGRHCDDF